MNIGLYFVVNGWGEPAKMREKVLLLFTALFFFAFLTSFTSALPIGTETPITSTLNSLTSPAIYGDTIVWEDSRDPNTIQIYKYNLTTGEENPVNSSQNYQFQPAIYGNTVVWNEMSSIDYSMKIIRYDLVTRTRDEYSSNSDGNEYNYPKISRNTTVWQEYNVTNSNWDISVVRNTGSQPELIIYGDGDQKHPEIYQNYIVYENWTGIPYSSPSDIWLYNLTNNTAVPVSEVFYQETFPHIYGEKIVWEASNLSGDGTHIHVFDKGVITRLIPQTATPFDQFHPAIYGNRVVVEDARESALHDVYVYDLVAGSETRLSPKSFAYSQLNPDIYENRIVWADTRAGNGNVWDIYLFTLGPAVVCPVAGFSSTSPIIPVGQSVTFTDTSQGAPIPHRTWNFGDGSPVLVNPAGPVTHDFVSAGIYLVNLTMGNDRCRNITPVTCNSKIYVDSPPEADFYGSPVYGFTPLTVQFRDTSCGLPETWLWDFGDGNTSTMQDPSHTYLTPGTAYNVSLTVNNTFGNAATSTKLISDYIRTLIGATGRSITPVGGITSDQSNQKSILAVNGSLLTSSTITADKSRVMLVPPEQYGWQNITFASSDGTGFSEDANHTITGNFSRVYFHTKDLTATNNSYQIRMNYQFTNSKYPVQSVTTSEIWEGALPADKAEFEYFASMIPPTGFTTVSAIPFTAHVTKNPAFGDGNATINLSISSLWYDTIQETPTTPVLIIGTGKDSSGNTIGAGLKPSRYRSGGIDYFVTDTPVYLTKFGLAQVSGSGNPFQLITLTVASHIGSGGGGEGGTGGGTPVVVQNTVSPEIKPTTPPDPGKTAKIYANPQGVITQATILQSADGLATVSIGEGIVAKDSNGKALLSIRIKPIPAEGVPAIPPGTAFAFQGMAYDLQPDNVTFFPAISINFTVPQEWWGQEFVVKTFDTSSGTWQDVPTIYNPNKGVVTAEVSHFCCFALFAKTVSPSSTVTQMPVQLPTRVAVAPPPPTAISTFSGMILWIIDMMTKNVLVVAGIILLAVALFLYGRKRRRDRVMHLR